MRVELLRDAAAFLDAAEPLLLAEEARHNLMLGIAGDLRDGRRTETEARFWIVLDGVRPTAAAMQTPPYNLILARPAVQSALADAVEDELPGVVGGLPEAAVFAERWAARTGSSVRRTMHQGVCALDELRPLPRASGAARAATAADRPLLLDWFRAFGREVLHAGSPGRGDLERTVDGRLGDRSCGFLLWDDAGRTVSLAGWGSPTPTGIRVGPVYTPPERRGRGYATALTAELSRRLLEGGKRFCFLYTDLANPVSNAIYERIGYRRVCESAELAFVRP